MEFHWWFILIGVVLALMIFGKGKGGIVIERFTASLKVLDERFKDCRTEAKYHIFKKGPDHIEIEIENLPLPPNDELEFEINGSCLARVKVERDREAEFDYWSDEDVSFPRINAGDELVIKHQGIAVFQGIFRLAG